MRREQSLIGSSPIPSASQHVLSSDREMLIYEFFHMKENMPFKELSDAKHGGYFFDLREVKENPNLIVKELKLEKFEEYFGGGTQPRDAAGYIQNYYQQIKQHGLNEFVPRSQVVIGKNVGDKETVFVISDKINGEPLEREMFSNISFNELTDKAKSNFKKIVTGLIDIYIDTFNGETGEVPEFSSLENYIVGEDKTDTNNYSKIYFVDLFPVERLGPKSVVDMLNSLENVTYSDFYTERIKLGKLSKKQR